MNKPKFMLLTCLFSFSTASFADQTVYRCGEAGHYTFSTQPCSGDATPVKIAPTRLSTDPNPYQAITEAYKKDLVTRSNTRKHQDKPINQRPRPQSKGLSLAAFNRIFVGMSEGEVMFRVGNPENVTIDSVNIDTGITQKSYYYIKRGFNSNITRFIFINGNLSEKRRELIKNR